MSDPVLVTCGTSLTAERGPFWRRRGGHWVAQLRATLRGERGIHVINRAIWGATSRQGATQLQPTLGHARLAATLEFAINDADRRRHLSVTESVANIRSLIHQLRAVTEPNHIALLITGPCYGRHARLRPQLADYYDAHRELAQESGIVLLNSYPDWLQQCATSGARRVLPDGIHPSRDAEVQIVAPLVREFLREALGP